MSLFRLSRACRATVVAAVLALVTSAAPSSAATVAALPLALAQVKAAFLYNFAKFVEWPGQATGPLVIGVAGDDAFAAIVKETVRGRSVNGREVQVRRLDAAFDPAGCQVVFIGAMRPRDAAELLARVSGPVLTVGETVQFMRDGGMVRFFVDDNNLRFQINQKNAEAAGLKIRAQLLQLAVP